MHRREFLSRTVSTGLLSGATCYLTGCGTLLHSERQGRPHSRDLDWTIVALDALGLVLFFVPGVVAFAVDFYTGAIFLPHEGDDSCLGCEPERWPTEAVPPPPAVPHAVDSVHGIGVPSPQFPQPQPPQPQFPQPQQPQTQYPQLQPPQHQQPQLGSPQVGVLRQLTIPRSELNRQTIQQVVGRQIGRPVALADPAVRVSQLPRLDDFLVLRQRHRADRDFGASPQEFFARLLSA
jgi:hypothetical protein